MNIVISHDPDKLVAELEVRCKEGYIFRGQPDANVRYKLTPNAFRPKSQEEFSKNFPVPRKQIQKWFSSEGIQKNNFWTLKMPKADSQQIQSLAKPLFDFLIYLMQYNYGLHQYFKKNPHKVSQNHQNIIELHPPQFWIEEKTVVYFFDAYYPRLLEYRATDGSLIQEANPFETLTGIDETYPQHYGVPTAALDWSYNPYIAIYFALDNNIDPTSKMPPSNYFSIYAYREITKTESSSISIIGKNKLVDNERANRQEGTFTYFKNPCSFYLEHRRFPCIEDYDNGRFFELIKYSVPRNETTLKLLDNLLKEKGISYSFLFPDS